MADSPYLEQTAVASSSELDRSWRTEISGMLIIALRDLLKFVRNKPRIAGTLIFPVIFIGILGTSFQSGFGESLGYNFITYTFTGVLAQTLFQTTTQGIISLIEDRENDFAQEMFVSPISRYTIIGGKILGESIVALCQAVVVIIFGWIIGVPMTLVQVAALIPVSLIASLYGGAFGLLVLSNLSTQRAAQQIFPFIIFPQFFLAGVFTPIQDLPWYLDWASRITPMRYAVDLTRNFFYAGLPTYDQVVMDPPWLNFTVIAVTFTIFLVTGTTLFVRSETNR